MTNVSLFKCNDYNLDEIKTIIERSFEGLGGLKNLIKPGHVVFLKVNAVSNLSSSLGYTTNPIFLKAMIQVLKQINCKIIVGDNPPFHALKKTLKGNGMMAVCEEEHVEIAENTLLMTISNSKSFHYSSFEVSKQMIECDCLINLPKLKTHALTYFSGAIKNYFGLIYGLEKAKWHVKASDPLTFSAMICDLYQAVKESFKDKVLLNFCDGIVALEGEGPTTGGKARPLGAIIASQDALALDVVAIKLAGLEIEKSPITTTAIKANLGTGDLNNIKIIGERVESFSTNLVEPKKTHPGGRILQYQWIKNILLETPKVSKVKCIKCGECTKICPPQTMKIINGNYPHLQNSRCIRCWCCAEVCPKGAITKGKRPILGRIIISKK